MRLLLELNQVAHDSSVVVLHGQGRNVPLADDDHVGRLKTVRDGPDGALSGVVTTRTASWPKPM
jgi:hypothetical protein